MSTISWAHVHSVAERAAKGDTCVCVSFHSQLGDEMIDIASTTWLGLDAAKAFRDELDKAIESAQAPILVHKPAAVGVTQP